MREQGLYVAIDGSDAVGKSSQVPLVTEALIQAGVNPVIEVNEFSDSPVGELIKSILSNQRFYSLTPDKSTPIADTALILADLAFQIETSIFPTIEEGGIAVCDRGPASLVAYQGLRIKERSAIIEQSTAIDWTKVLSQHCLLAPDLTVLLQIDENKKIERIIKRGESKPTEKDLLFLRQVDDLLEKAAKETSKEVVIIDGNKNLDTVSQEIFKSIIKIYKALPNNVKVD